ncbi:MAG: zf-HC2 domain-containing protein [Armatimonadetes bacterium]|nr:zf-HC2 domain-containing protein [Armatimonadota bacterium]
MNCRDVRRNLLAWVEGELDEATWLAVTQHVESCEYCREEAEKWRQIVATVRAVAKSDGIPPVPKRLIAQLQTQKVRLPSFVSVFITACLAFLLGWHARSIALSRSPNQTDSSLKATTISATKPKKGCRLIDALLPINAKPFPVAIRNGVSDGETFGGRPSFLKRLPKSLFEPTNRASHFHPLTLNGATAFAFGADDLSKRCLFNRTSMRKEVPSDESADEATDEPIVLVPWSLALVWEQGVSQEPQTYRIFVQVTDPQSQTVRAIKVDTTEHQSIVAEWSEQEFRAQDNESE